MTKTASGFVLLVALLCGRAPAQVKPEAASGWRTLAVADVEELHDAVVQLHPGFRDPESPGFASVVKGAYRRARGQAEGARSYGDWQAATSGFMLSFRDGHTIYRLNQNASRVRWPGFLIDGQNGVYVVRTPSGVVAKAAGIPEGAEVVSCDGVPMADLLKTTLDTTEADWSKEPERIRQAYRFFLDPGTEGATRAKQCRFVDAKGSVDVKLNWQVEQWTAIAPSLGTYNRERTRTIAQKTLDDGGRWLTLGSFGQEEKLNALAAALEADTAALRKAPYVVFDVRGNRGGNSTWGDKFGALLFGQEAVDNSHLRKASQLPRRGGKFWRASPEAERRVRGEAANFAALGPAFQQVADYWNGVADLIRKAPMGDSELVADPCCEPEEPGPVPAVVHAAFSGPAFVLTDAGCFSSCVLAVEALKALGVKQIGECTGQNKEYGESVGPFTTGSGLARYQIPVSIIRQRRAELKQSPERRWGGAMDDDAGLERWVQSMVRGMVEQIKTTK